MRFLRTRTAGGLLAASMIAQAHAQSAAPPAAVARHDVQAATHAAPSRPLVAPKTPGGASAGAVQGDHARMNATVGGIDNHLLNQEKDRPKLPNQAPSPSQTLPGGTASGQAPR